MAFAKALSIFLGTVIGVGMFGLPFVAMKAGFLVVTIYFLLMAVIVTTLHILYGDIIFATEGNHRLPGYAEKYLDHKWKRVAFISMFIGITGALLAYLIVGGEFLFFLFSPSLGGDLILYTVLFFIAGSFLIFRGIKSISLVELSLLLVLFIILVLFFIKTLPFINIDHLKTLDFKFITFPYGVVLFSLWGSAVLPEIKEMLVSQRKKEGKLERVPSDLRKVILSGVIIATIAYLLFVFMVLGVSGPDTSGEAISGLGAILGENGIIGLGFIFGIISCFTSFIALGLALKKMLWYDFGIPKNLSWALTCFIPLILFLVGMRKFINIIGFTGAVAIGIEGIIITWIYRKFLKQKLSRKMNPVFYVLPLILIVGIILEGFYLLTL